MGHSLLQQLKSKKMLAINNKTGLVTVEGFSYAGIEKVKHHFDRDKHLTVKNCFLSDKSFLNEFGSFKFTFFGSCVEKSDVLFTISGTDIKHSDVEWARLGDRLKVVFKGKNIEAFVGCTFAEAVDFEWVLPEGEEGEECYELSDETLHGLRHVLSLCNSFSTNVRMSEELLSDMVSESPLLREFTSSVTPVTPKPYSMLRTLNSQPFSKKSDVGKLALLMENLSMEQGEKIKALLGQ